MVRLNTPVVDDPESGFADQGSLKEFSPGAMALAACDLSSTKLAGAGVDLGRLGAERMRMMRVLDQAAVVELRKFAYLSQLAWAGTLLKQFGNYADATCLYIGHPHGRQLRLGSMCDFRWRLRVHKVTVIADISFGWPLPALGVTFPRWWATLANDLNKMKKLVHNKVGLLKIRMRTTTEVQLAFARRSLVMKYKQRPGCLRVIRGSCGVKLSGRTSFLLRIEQKKMSLAIEAPQNSNLGVAYGHALPCILRARRARGRHIARRGVLGLPVAGRLGSCSRMATAT